MNNEYNSLLNEMKLKMKKDYQEINKVYIKPVVEISDEVFKEKTEVYENSSNEIIAEDTNEVMEKESNVEITDETLYQKKIEDKKLLAKVKRKRSQQKQN